MKAAEKKKYLIKLAESKPRTLRGVFYFEGRFVDRVRVERLGFSEPLFVKIILFADKVKKYARYSELLNCTGIHFLDVLPFEVKMVKGRKGFWLEVEREEVGILDGAKDLHRGYLLSESYPSLSDTHFDFTPLLEYVLNSVCFVQLLDVLRGYAGNHYKKSMYKSELELVSALRIELAPVLSDMIDYVKNESNRLGMKIKAWDATFNKNYLSLERQLNAFVRDGVERYVAELKLFYPIFDKNNRRVYYDLHQAKNHVFELFGGRFKTLTDKVNGCIWKVEYAEEGVQLLLVLFLRVDEVDDPSLLRKQLGECWARDVVPDSIGGYAVSFWGLKKSEEFPITKLQYGQDGWYQKVKDIVSSVLVQDLVWRHRAEVLNPLADEEQGSVESGELGEGGEVVLRRPRSYAFIGKPQERTRFSQSRGSNLKTPKAKP
ncbi:hypothetical protein [Chitinibacter tainanensis]|uniref:hypothetical protein n=1 Tax=Chitinibacter tainanensis TaxID=230667 RepID=UPI0023577046|nr:hypothetical protein [Chitinibacter tainanensis]